MTGPLVVDSLLEEATLAEITLMFLRMFANSTINSHTPERNPNLDTCQYSYTYNTTRCTYEADNTIYRILNDTIPGCRASRIRTESIAIEGVGNVEVTSLNSSQETGRAGIRLRYWVAFLDLESDCRFCFVLSSEMRAINRGREVHVHVDAVEKHLLPESLSQT